MNLNKLIILARTGYDLLVKGASKLKSPLLLVIRLYWGWEFFLSGKGKLADLSGPTEFFTTLGIPFPAFNAALAGTTECVGGLFILLGLATRLTTIPLIVTMLVAYITADREAFLSFFSDPDKFFAATPFLFLFASVLTFVFGPGVFSVDHLLKRKLTAAADHAAQAQEFTKPFVHDSPRAIAH
jgi:putative oxidoreductase